MVLELSKREFRRLLDLVYIGNWVMNSNLNNRISDYDDLQSKIFSQSQKLGLTGFVEVEDGEIVPSTEFVTGGIHDVILDYEDTAFFEILAEELARRDMGYPPIDESNSAEFAEHMEEYILEFQQYGIDHITLR